VVPPGGPPARRSRAERSAGPRSPARARVSRARADASARTDARGRLIRRVRPSADAYARPGRTRTPTPPPDRPSLSARAPAREAACSPPKGKSGIRGRCGPRPATSPQIRAPRAAAYVNSFVPLNAPCERADGPFLRVPADADTSRRADAHPLLVGFHPAATCRVRTHFTGFPPRAQPSTRSARPRTHPLFHGFSALPRPPTRYIPPRPTRTQPHPRRREIPRGQSPPPESASWRPRCLPPAHGPPRDLTPTVIPSPGIHKEMPHPP
jgi:hypothetical protein